jgi:hypothetical protein
MPTNIKRFPARNPDIAIITRIHNPTPVKMVFKRVFTHSFTFFTGLPTPEVANIAEVPLVHHHPRKPLPWAYSEHA